MGLLHGPTQGRESPPLLQQNEPCLGEAEDGGRTRPRHLPPRPSTRTEVAVCSGRPAPFSVVAQTLAGQGPVVGVAAGIGLAFAREDLIHDLKEAFRLGRQEAPVA